MPAFVLAKAIRYPPILGTTRMFATSKYMNIRLPFPQRSYC